MRIVSDIDGVWVDFVTHFYAYLGTKLEIVTNWEVPFINKNFHEIANDPVFWQTIPPLSHPVHLPERFQIIAYLSAFPKEMMEAREHNMRFAPAAPIYHHLTKVEWLEERVEEWDIYVDDKPTTIAQCREKFPDKHIIRFVPHYMTDIDAGRADLEYSIKKARPCDIRNFAELEIYNSLK